MATAPLVWALTGAAALASLATAPFVATAIEYRRRDNGLAYIVCVLGIGVWNGMFAVQVLAASPLVRTFFLSLAIVGGLLGGLGWFMFAATATSTPAVPNQRLVFGAAAVLVGIDIALAVTAPVHDVFWAPLEPAAGGAAVVVSPRVGYWLHTQLLAVLFAAGAALFAAGWSAGSGLPFSRYYTLAGAATAVAVVGSNLLAPGGLPVAPVVAASLATIGWVQARRGRILPRWR